eukprot:XP_025983881.1 structural maintenance of chromosomes protein 2-2-like [Glycine max]
MTLVEQPLKKRKLYEPLPEPPPSSPPESEATPPSPQTLPTPSTPPLSKEDILAKWWNKDEIRSVSIELIVCTSEDQQQPKMVSSNKEGVLAGKSSGNEEKCIEDQLRDAKERMAEMDCMQKLKDGIRNLSANLANVEFTYHDPFKNFDRSKVKGVVAKLIKVNDRSSMTALEVTAAGKLYNVVDTENTGKQLLQNGNLRRRVTIIPLNKIQSYNVSSRVQQAVVRLVGKGNAEIALSLVGYEEELQSAMEYVFGSTFVCKTVDAAKEVAFNREIHTTSVTLEGDIFQPSGLLTGGSRKYGALSTIFL